MADGAVGCVACARQAVGCEWGGRYLHWETCDA